jgi:hypothetical protein
MKFYRYDTVEFAEMDSDTGEYIDKVFPNPQLRVNEYDLLKETPKGYWIGYGSMGDYKYNWKKWVSKTSRKRFAYPTKEEALENYIKRTEKRLRILDWQVSECRIGLDLAKAKKDEILNTNLRESINKKIIE